MSDILITSKRYDSAGNLAYTVDPQGTIGASEYDAAGRVTKRIANVADPDAEDFFTRASITDAEQQVAVTLLVLDLKKAGLWSKMVAIYPFVGGTASAHSENLRANTYAISWVNSPTQNAAGVTGNGTNAYGAMAGLGADGAISTSDFSCGVYTSVVPSPGNRTDFGGYDAGNYVIIRSRAYDVFDFLLGTISTGSGPSSTNVVGLRVITSDGDLRQYENGTSLGSPRTVAGTIPPNLNVLTTNDIHGLYSTATISFAFVGTFLTASENVSLASIVKTFQGALGR